MTRAELRLDWQPLPAPACQLGESPFWHPDEQALYWVDIPGRALHRWQPGPGAGGTHRHWALPTEPGCIAPLPDGRLLMGRRDGLFRFDTVWAAAGHPNGVFCAAPAELARLAAAPVADVVQEPAP